MARKTNTVTKADKLSLKRIVIDLKSDEHDKLKRAADSDLLPVKGAARKYLLVGLSVLSDKKGERAFGDVSTGQQAIEDMPF